MFERKPPSFPRELGKSESSGPKVAWVRGPQKCRRCSTTVDMPLISLGMTTLWLQSDNKFGPQSPQNSQAPLLLLFHGKILFWITLPTPFPLSCIHIQYSRLYTRCMKCIQTHTLCQVVIFKLDLKLCILNNFSWTVTIIASAIFITWHSQITLNLLVKTKLMSSQGLHKTHGLCIESKSFV